MTEAHDTPADVLDRLHALLQQLLAAGGSDLHLASAQPPLARVNGELRPLGGQAWTATALGELCARLAERDGRLADWQRDGGLDLGLTLGGERFRINLLRSLGRAGLVARHLDGRLRSFAQLGLPASLAGLADIGDGLVLVTGATGSGKSTTLAALVHEINRQHARHILTIEDPVEFVHEPIRAHVTHRGLHQDFPDFASAVRAALRQDPDVILVGEMRDLETMRAALTAAETGHLVLGTLHTADTVGTVERVVGGFPGDEQDTARYRLASCLRAVVSQRLVPRRDGHGRTALAEVLVVNTAVAHLIASGRSKQIHSLLESGTEHGMQTFDHSLAAAVGAGRLGLDEARALARDPARLGRLLAEAGARGATRSPHGRA
ncbi:type IV pilus twitching motility protein PilT [Rubrivivax gelatinosus]|uniref:Twitching motility protein PilT n=1 Tax=Rubrivivax gelatinosus TaxID=28068 RepID=A0A4R2MAY4_RUBGE|nr:PilT/PilU family type 4a pilus ATPase [Rubrivivax gelatinosus]TCP01514.1 twitching motility protein PilT [Rubrivivax gelatinosus]